jgi:hypothetical protein
MAKHDDSLEVGLAAGLDVPTAIVLSEDDEPPQWPRLGRWFAWALFFGSVATLALWWLAD